MKEARMYYNITVKEIENGWLFQIDLPGKPLVTKWFYSEFQALAAAQIFFEEAVQQTIKETQEIDDNPAGDFSGATPDNGEGR